MDTAGQPPPPPAAAGQRPTWLPMAEAVRQLGISERTIRRRLAAKEYNARRVGKVTLIGVPGDAWHGPAPSGDASGAAGDVRQTAENARNATQEAQEGASDSAAGDSLTTAHEARVAALEANLRDVRAQLEARTREVSELHVLLGRAQLAAPRDAPASGETAPAPPPRPAAPRAPWWAIWRRR